MNRSRILLADDHAIVIEGLRRILERQFDVVGEVEDGRALVAAAKKLKPDVIVTDISMPLLNGIEAARQIKKENLQAKIIFLTMHPDVTYATEAFEAGAAGYVLKHSVSSELLTAIDEAVKDRLYVTPRIAKQVMESLLEGSSAGHNRSDRLTPRQREVLQLLAEGHTIQEAGDILHVSPRTVEFHKYRIEAQLGLRSTAELTQYAVKHGIVSP